MAASVIRPLASTSRRHFASCARLSRALPSLLQSTSSLLPPPLTDNPPTPIPTFTVLDSHGKFREGASHWSKPGQLGDMGNKEFARNVYRVMMGLPQIDVIMSNIQRQGRISFYMTSYGEEASIVCSAAAWGPSDPVFAQYREQGVLLYRGYDLDKAMAQCFGTAADESTLGRQMPIHYGSPAHHFFTISSPLATQIPQAAGAAYALKGLREKGQRENDAVICYFGEGAASEGDFHAGLNMAAVLGGPIVFFIRNNGFAISTPAAQQYRGDGIASRAAGYGMDVIRVDGNDPVAVYLASKEAKRRALEGEGRPVMLEAITYRVGHHSTSDDSAAYRSKGDVEHWKVSDNPLHRMRQFLESRGWWSQQEEDASKLQWKTDLSTAIRKAEKTKRPSLATMFQDTFEKVEPHILEQQNESNSIRSKWSAYSGYKSDDRHET